LKRFRGGDSKKKSFLGYKPKRVRRGGITCEPGELGGKNRSEGAARSKYELDSFPRAGGQKKRGVEKKKKKLKEEGGPASALAPRGEKTRKSRPEFEGRNVCLLGSEG